MSDILDSPAVKLTQSEHQNNVFLEGLEEIPTAVGDLVRGVEHHPLQFAEHVAATVGVSAAASFALSYVLPAGGPYGMILGAAMMVPTAINIGKGLWNAHKLAEQPGADTQAIGHQLADQAVAGSVDLGLNFVGGALGAKAAYAVADSDTAFGAWSRDTRSYIAGKENDALVKIKQFSGQLSDMFKSATSTASDAGPLAFKSAVAQNQAASQYNIDPYLKDMPSYKRAMAAMANRADQVSAQPLTAEGQPLPDAPPGYSQKFGNFHSHSSYSDGDGTPQQLYDNAKKAGYDFWDVSEHNHDGARLGVEAGSERADAEADVPLLAQDPAEWRDIKTAAQNATVPGKFQAGVGEEMGVLGKDPPKVGADGNPLPGGANHTILRNFDQTFVRSDRPQSKPSFLDRLTKPILHLFGKDTPDNVADIPDGRYDLLGKYLAANEDPNNPAQAIGAHPRWLSDTSSKTPANLRLHDYGINEMGGVDNWAANYGSKHFVGLEVMKGEALNPGPVSTLRPQDIDLTSYNGYMDLFGDKVKAAPYTGLDIHYKGRIGNPDAATGLLVTKLDAAGINDAVAGRRTIATSSMSKLSGYMAADNGKFIMGQTIDQGAVPDGVTPEVRINGDVTPDASYKVNLWMDPKLGDGSLAKVVQTKTISGSDLLSSGQTVSFNPVKPKLGDSSAFYVEVQRTDAASPKFGDVLGTWNTAGSGARAAATAHADLLKAMSTTTVEGPHGGTMMASDLQAPLDPMVENAYATDPHTPYPERMITAPIWIQPITGGAQQSTFMQGLAGTLSQLAPLPKLNFSQAAVH